MSLPEQRSRGPLWDGPLDSRPREDQRGIADRPEPTGPDDPRAPRRGTVLAGRFLVQGVIGRGGMGVVVRAMDQVTGHIVALKHVRPDLPDQNEDPEEYGNRLMREAQLARDVSHNNVCRVHDVYQHEGEVLLSMEYVEGETLRARLNRGALPQAEALDIARQICAGVAAAHQKGVVHRDLKPENVLLERTGRVVVLDFGVARKEGTPRETVTGLVQGTPRYMAPEQQQGKSVSPATDVFALGLVIEELFGERPPSWLRPIIRRATERDPVRRYLDAGQLGRDLTHPLSRHVRLAIGVGASAALAALTLAALPSGTLASFWGRGAPGAGSLAAVIEPQPDAISRPWGNAQVGTVSPDGKLLAFAEDCGDTRMGYLRPLLDKENPGRQFSGPGHSVTWINFSRDGRRLVYASGSFPLARQSEIFLVELNERAEPSPPRRLTDGMTPSFFPDGKSIALARLSPQTGRMFLARLALDGSQAPTPISTEPPSPQEVAPVVSPDGRQVAFLRDLTNQVLHVVAVEGGPVRSLATNPAANFPEPVVWTHDSRYLLYSTLKSGMFAVSVADGKPPVQLLSPSLEAKFPSLNADGSVLVYTRLPDRFDLRVRADESQSPRSLRLPMAPPSVSWPLLSPDGTALAVGIDTEQTVQQHPLQEPPVRTLVAVGQGWEPVAFVDQGRALIVARNKAGLRVLPLSDAPPPPIGFSADEIYAAVSPDGRWLATARIDSASRSVAAGVWVRPLSAPPEAAVSWIPNGMGRISWSADSKHLAAGVTGGGIAIATGPGPAQVRYLDPHDDKGQRLTARTVRFDGNDHLLFLMQPRVYRMDLKTEKVQPFLSSPRVAMTFGFAVEPTTRKTFYVAQEVTSDLWVLREPEKLLQYRIQRAQLLKPGT